MFYLSVLTFMKSHAREIKFALAREENTVKFPIGNGANCRPTRQLNSCVLAKTWIFLSLHIDFLGGYRGVWVKVTVFRFIPKNKHVSKLNLLRQYADLSI